jgi:hypothetical protein
VRDQGEAQLRRRWINHLEYGGELMLVMILPQTRNTPAQIRLHAHEYSSLYGIANSDADALIQYSLLSSYSGK